jgi:hypothetical protein
MNNDDKCDLIVKQLNLFRKELEDLKEKKRFIIRKIMKLQRKHRKLLDPQPVPEPVFHWRKIPCHPVEIPTFIAGE